MTKKLVTLFLIVFLAGTSFAQTQWTGRWSTDPAPKGWMGWTDSGALKVLSEEPNLLEPALRPPANPNQFPAGVQLDFKVDGERVTGFIGVDGLWGTPMRIELAKVEGKTVRFMSARISPGREPIYWLWTAELTDDNTIALHRSNIGGGRGGAGGLLQPGKPPAPAPTVLPPLNKSDLATTALTLHRK